MPSTRRKPGAVRRLEITAAALDLLGAGGLAALTTARLARAVGLTSGALFRHFASLDAVLAAAAEAAVERVEATFPEATLAPVERLFALVEARVRLLGREPGVAWLLRAPQARALPAPAAARLAAVAAASRRFIRTALRDGAAAGSVRRDVPTDVLAVMVVSTIHALVGPPPSVAGRPVPGARPSARRVFAGLRTILAPSPESPPRRGPSGRRHAR